MQPTSNRWLVYSIENSEEPDIIGFSRGAVTAISFAEAIEKLKEKKVSPYCRLDRIRFLGLYDPVPGPTIAHRPGIPKIVDHTAIAYSLDEKRTSFATKIYSGAGVVANGFRGGHSDVGGGYQERGLANIALEWMIDQGIAAGGPFMAYPQSSFSPRMVLHQEAQWFWHLRNRGLFVPNHPSVSHLYGGATQVLNGVEMTGYYLPYAAHCLAGDKRF